MIERKKMIEGRTDMAAHAEWRDDETAMIATKRAVAMLKQPVIACTFSTSPRVKVDWLNGITSLYGNGDDAHITTEALPQHLTYDERDVERQELD